MLTYIILVLVFTCTTHAAPVKCPGGYADGETVEKGSYWYVCKDGQLTMKGCLSDSKSRMKEHDTYKKGGYLYECASSSDGEFTIKYKGCIAENGQEFMLGGTWQDENFWYSCSNDGDRVKSEIKGCVDSGKRYNVHQSVIKGDLIYECSDAKGSIGFDVFLVDAMPVLCRKRRSRLIRGSCPSHSNN